MRKDCIGLTHRDTLPARKMLEAEGLRYQNHVDIFDAGPVLECHVSDLRTVRDSVVVPVEIGAPATVHTAEGGPRSLVSNTSLADFRVGAAPGAVADGRFVLTAADAAALGVAAGDPVRVYALKSQPRTHVRTLHRWRLGRR
ncbi:MAG: Arginine N-succinyltransferase [Burkholderia gladioli]|nr:MAG: Arginine N-succinyltransferase [Burkholderia gladioli]